MPRKRSERKKDTFEDVTGFYTAYLCGVLDVLAEFRATLFAADVKKTIKETVESIIKDAWALQR